MKKFKRLLAILLVFTMLFGVSAEVYADPVAFEEESGNVPVLNTGLQPFQFVEIPEEEVSDDLELVSDGKGGAAYHDSYWDQYTSYYIYNQMDENSKALYDNLYTVCENAINGTKSYTGVGGVLNGENVYGLDRAEYSGLTSDQAYETARIFCYQNPQFYFVSNMISWGSYGNTKYVQLNCYEMFNTGAERSAATSRMKEQLDAWNLQVASESTMLGKEIRAHDLIASAVDYRGTSMDQSAYSAIVDKTSVCAGYAKTLSMLLNAAGIDACAITSVPHAWTMARINGTWYYVDVTWDDQSYGAIYKWFNRDSSGIFTDDDGQSHAAESMWTPFLPQFVRDSGGTATAASPAGTLNKPVITQTKSGSKYQITITAGNTGSTCYYDYGTSKSAVVFDPGSGYSKSKVYSASFTVPSGVTVKAREEKLTYTDSAVASIVAGSEAEPEDPEDPEEPEDPTIAVNNITVSPTSLEMEIGDTKTVSATIYPSNATNRNVSWRSTYPSVATVSGTGKVTAVSAGTASIIATSEDGGLTASCQVTVKEAEAESDITGITLSETNITMAVGETKTLTSTVTPSSANDKRVNWSYESNPSHLFNSTSSSTSSSNPNSTFSFTASGIGTAVITATTEVGGLSAECYVTVLEATPEPEPEPDPVEPEPEPEPEPKPIDPDEPDEGGLTKWSVSEELGGSPLTMALSYTSKVEYDGRKHVVSKVGGKAVKASASVNPDIEVADFSVSLDGKELTGISIKSFSYKNNIYPSGEAETSCMQIIPTLAYNTKDAELSALLKQNKALKTTLNKMVKAKYDTKEEAWNYDPMLVTITPLDITGFPLYTAAELKSDTTLKNTNNILVWNGKGYKVSGGKYKEDGETYYYATKVTVPGLYVQKVFDLGNGKTGIKKLNLRAGGYSMKSKTYREDGETWVDRWMVLSTKKFDYYFDESEAENYEPGEYIQPILNTSGHYMEDQDGDSKLFAGAGYFTGELPSFETK